MCVFYGDDNAGRERREGGDNERQFIRGDQIDRGNRRLEPPKKGPLGFFKRPRPQPVAPLQFKVRWRKKKSTQLSLVSRSTPELRGAAARAAAAAATRNAGFDSQTIRSLYNQRVR